MNDFCCPVAYPVALPDSTCLGVAVRFSRGSSRWLGSAAVPIGRPRARLHASEELAADGVEADHVKVWQAVGKLRRRHGLVMNGEPRQPGYRVEDWTWETRRIRS